MKLMMLKKVILLSSLIMFQMSAFAACELKVRTDSSDAVYKCNQNVIFKVWLLDDSKPVSGTEINYKITTDGYKCIKQGRTGISDGYAEIFASIPMPGFLRCEVEYVDSNGAKKTALAAAGIEPTKIKPSMEMPEDFDKFWDGKIKELSNIPIEPKLTPVHCDEEGIEVYDVKLKCLGRPVSGYLAKPAGVQNKTLPAILIAHGAGACSARLDNVVFYAKKSALVFEINAHGIENGKSDGFYRNILLTKLRDYPYWGKDDRDKSYFTGMYLRLMRALEFLKDQPEWDGKNLITWGGSQGGGQAIAAAGLDADVSAVVAAMPAMCDHTGVVNGWPWLVYRDASGKYDEKVFQASRYVDVVNFARRTKAFAVLDVGFIDTTCRPTSVYSAFNSLQGKKYIYNQPLLGHEFPMDVECRFWHKIRQNMK